MSLSLEKEDNEHYHIKTPKGHVLMVPKSQLTDTAHEFVKKMAGGGTVPDSEVDPDYDNEVATPKALPGGVPTPAGMPAADQNLPGSSWIDRAENAVGNFFHQKGPSGPSGSDQTTGPSGSNLVPAPTSVSNPTPVAVRKNSAPKKDMSPAQQPIPYSTPPSAASSGGGYDPVQAEQGQVGQLLNQQQSEAEQYQSDLGELGAKEAQPFNEAAQEQQSMKTPLQAAEEFNATDEASVPVLNKIDPNRLMHNMDTGNKILGGISLILGGIGAGMQHSGTNPALQIMQDAINRDVNAQMADNSNLMNTYKMHQQQFQNEQQARIATTNNLWSWAQAKAQSAAANAKTAQAQFAGGQLVDSIKQQKIQNNFMQGMLAAPAQGQPGQQQGQKSGLINADPSYLVENMVQDPNAKKQVYEEIKNAQNVGRNGPAMLSAFDQAQKDTSGMGAATSMGYEPGSVKRLKQLMLPNFKTIDGTVRQAAMDESFNNIIPVGTDTSDRLNQKKQALQQWMTSETAAPTAKGHGIDLSRFAGTAPPQLGQSQKVIGQKTVQGKQFVKYDGQPGWHQVNQ